jgi:LacI family transcriptional regulator
MLLGDDTMKSTIGDVAKLSGVSITTVSRVINNNYPVKKETRLSVEKAIQELNYKPNPLAQGLISKRSNTIGIVVPGITNMFFTEVIHGVEKYVKAKGYDVLLSNSNGDADAEMICVNKLANKFVDGIIVVDPQTSNIKAHFYDITALNMPLICINGYHENTNVNFVIANEEKGTSEAIEHLLKQGHNKIAFVRGGESYSYDIKEEIYRSYMKKLGLRDFIIDTQDGNSIEVVNNTAKKIIELNEKNILGKDITAFFACNDLMAVGILNGCSEININVPNQVSIIGFDNIILSQMIKPKLSTVDQNMKKLGITAAENIVRLIENKELRCNNVIIETKLIIRDSCN